MFTFMFIMFIILGTLAVGSVIADCIIPKCKFLEDFMHSLPMFWD